MKTGWYSVEVKLSASTNCILGDDIPIELYRVINDTGQFSNHEVDVSYSGSVGILRVIGRNTQNTFSNGKLMHVLNYTYII